MFEPRLAVSAAPPPPYPMSPAPSNVAGPKMGPVEPVGPVTGPVAGGRFTLGALVFPPPHRAVDSHAAMAQLNPAIVRSVLGDRAIRTSRWPRAEYAAGEKPSPAACITAR